MRGAAGSSKISGAVSRCSIPDVRRESGRSLLSGATAARRCISEDGLDRALLGLCLALDLGSHRLGSWSTFGSDLLVLAQASSARQISSATLRSWTCATTSIYARSPSVIRTLSGRTRPSAEAGISDSWFSLIASLLIGCGRPTPGAFLSVKPRPGEEDY